MPRPAHQSCQRLLADPLFEQLQRRNRLCCEHAQATDDQYQRQQLHGGQPHHSPELQVRLAKRQHFILLIPYLSSSILQCMLSSIAAVGRGARVGSNTQRREPLRAAGHDRVAVPPPCVRQELRQKINEAK
jgi:hypothetical protein